MTEDRIQQEIIMYYRNHYQRLYVNCLIHKKIIVPYNKLGNNMTEYFKNYSEKFI